MHTRFCARSGNTNQSECIYYVYTRIYVCVCTYIYVCVCVCVCVCVYKLFHKRSDTVCCLMIQHVRVPAEPPRLSLFFLFPFINWFIKEATATFFFFFTATDVFWFTGMFEYQLEARFLYEAYYHFGARHSAYTPICACGPSASVLHYGHAGAPNDQVNIDI